MITGTDQGTYDNELYKYVIVAGSNTKIKFQSKGIVKIHEIFY